MKRAVLNLLLSALVLALAACGRAAEPVHLESTLPVPSAIPTERPLPTSTSEPTGLPVPAAPTLSFDTATYRDETAGFELDYPAGWALDGGERHSRGYFVQFYSWSWRPGEAVESIPPGETVLSLTVNDWDPKNDLEAYLDQRRLAWDASGIVVLTEERVTLSGGWPAAQFTVQGLDGTRGFFLFTTAGEQYLTLSGSGDLSLLADIANTLRRIS